ncbi:MAG: type IX secretion system membrane protein PorP/SprF [Ferruginibacter sp.]|nr:type IX secretion system membrane protein PorP/SprF [Ferruginibacter sp.]
MRRKHLILLSLMLISGKCFSQDPHFSQFFASPLTLNPAYTGKFDGLWRVAANHRDQWPTIPKAYVTTSASFDFPILQKYIPEGDVFGVGVSALTDASASNILKLNYGSLAVSYHKSLDENSYNTIGVGFQGTYSSMTLDITRLTFEDELRQNGFAQGTSGEYTGSNPLTGRLNNGNYFEGNAGILFSGSTNGENNYYLGVSMYHITQPRVSFKDISWYLNNRLTIHGGGSFPLSESIGVNFSIINQSQNKASETVLGGAVSINANGDKVNPTNVYVGSWLRLNDAFIPYIGLEFNNFRIGASYDINTSSLKTGTSSRGGSEFSLIYIKRPPESKGIPCPRF